MKTAIFFYCLLLSYSIVNSQTITRDGGQITNASNFGFIKGNHLPDQFLSSDGKSIRYEDIQGSPYIDNYSGANNNLPIGKVYTADKEFINTAFIRYNAYTDNMEVSLMDDGVDYYLLKKEKDFLFIILKKKTYRAYEYELNSNSKVIGFFVILSESDTDECTLLSKEKVVFNKESKPKNSFLTPNPANFNRVRDTYYLKFENEIKEVPNKRKNLWVLFPKKAEEMKVFINTEKIKTSNVDDLLNVVNYYNALNK